MNKKIVYIENEQVYFVGVSPQYNDQMDLVLDTLPRNCVYNILEDNIDIDAVFTDSIFGKIDNNEKIKIDYNISKAKEIWLEHYRRARTPILAALDVDFMRAVESSNTDLQKEIASKKQALRDVTKTDLPNTLEEIKNTWPEILGKNPFNR
jgi:hypothetical protein